MNPLPNSQAPGGEARVIGITPQARRWLERVQVEVAAIVTFAAAWLVVWPLIEPWDPHGALTFLPTGEVGRLVGLAGAVWVLAAAAALLTPTARTEGSLLAALAGVAALGLHSGPMATLLQQSEQHLSATFTALAAETAIMAVVLGGALVVIKAVQAAITRLLGRWAWSARLAAPDQDAGPGGRPGWPPAANLAGCVVLELAVAIVVLVLTFRSGETGQIAFALAVSFFAGAWVAHQTFPLRSSVPLWLGPLALGVAILALGGHVAEGKGPSWYQAMMVSQAHKLPLRAALPVHWLGLGCGGAMAGVWLSRRMRDSSRAD